jgi:ribosomal protein S21
MKINIVVEKNPNESATSLIRRFSRKVQSAGILNEVKSKRYKKRAISPYTRKKSALKLLKRREEIKKLIKLGKLPDNKNNNQ